MGELLARTVADGLTYPESPRWHDGALWCTDVPEHRVIRWTPSHGCETVVDTTELLGHEVERPKLGPSGLDFLPDGTVLMAMMSADGPLRTTLLGHADGRTTVYADLSEVVTGRLNDMVVTEQGDVYVGALDAAAIVHISASRAASVALRDVRAPNGMVVSADGSELLYVTAGTSVYAAPILNGGRLGRPRLWADLTLEAALRRHLVNGTSEGPIEWSDLDAVSGADGLALDAEGAVWVGGVSMEKFVRITFGGFVSQVIHTPGRHAIACNLGGPDRRTLYLTSAALKAGSARTGGIGSPQLLEQLERRETSGYLEAVDVPVPGAGRP